MVGPTRTCLGRRPLRFSLSWLENMLVGIHSADLHEPFVLRLQRSRTTEMDNARQPLNVEPAPSDQSLRALDGVNFFVSAALASFGPFVTVLLGEQGWPQDNIGFVLTLGSIAGLVAQYPAGSCSMRPGRSGWHWG